MGFVNAASNFVQGITLRLFSDWQVTGVENVPPSGPLIIVANHQSYTDPSLLSTSMPRRIGFLAKHTIFRGPVITWFLRQYGAFPLNREKSDLQAFRWVLSQLKGGQAIVVFPEGTRRPGSLGRARSGVARLALAAQAPLLPVAITGTERLGSYLRVLRPSGDIRVRIGPTFSPPPLEGKPSKEVLNSFTDIIMHRIAALLPESYRGVYGTEESQPVGSLQ